MIQSTISFYVMEFYKQFAAYTTQQLQEFGLSFGMMYFGSTWANIPAAPRLR